MMQQVDERVKVVARVSLPRTGLEVAFLGDGTALLSCAHWGVCPGCGREWETGEAFPFTPQEAWHLLLALRPLLTRGEILAIMETLREC